MLPCGFLAKPVATLTASSTIRGDNSDLHEELA